MIRIGAMFCVKEVLPKLHESYVVGELLKWVKKAAEDAVPNIRIAAIEAVVVAMQAFESSENVK